MPLLSWLEERGLGDYGALLEKHGVDMDVLPHLEYAHLAEMGLSIGARLKLLKEIDKGLRETQHQDAKKPSGPSAERRQLTAMFCDIVGYTRLSADLDPEETRRLLREYWKAVKSITARFGGHIAQYLGDGALIYFGYPAALEDDAERAVNAALALLAHNQEAEGHGAADLHMRIGIATGPVVVGLPSQLKSRPEDALAVGSNVNLAARLQAMAAPDSLLIDDVTRKLVGDLFVLEPLGEQTIAGLEKPKLVFQVIASRLARSRFEAKSRSRSGIFLGRGTETTLAIDAWRKVQAGACHVVSVRGEPGIGKSHFVWQLTDTIASEGFEVIQLQCTPGQANTPFFPLAEAIMEQADVSPGATDEEKARKLRKLVGSQLDLSSEQLVVLGGLVGSASNKVAAPMANPAVWRKQAFQILRRFFVEKAAVRPLVLVVEDMHWCDPTSLEFLQSIVSDSAPAPILMITTSRPDGWQALNAPSGKDTKLFLERLTADDTTGFVKELLGRDAPKAIVDLIFERTDGVPLFVEELTNVILEKDLLLRTGHGVELSRQLDMGDIPSNLQSILLARLDRLGEHKRLAHVASCIGRSFSIDVLAGVADVGETAFKEGLEVLQSAELIHSSGGLPSRQFTFRHALIRDAAYGTLLAADRRDIHARIAEVMPELPNFDSLLRPEDMAFHLARAERFEEAIVRWHEAAVVANYRSASEEAIAYLKKGLELLEHVEGKSRREALEFLLLIELVAPYRSVRGFAAPEVGETTRRAIQLADQAQDVDAILPLLYNQWVYVFVTGHRDDGDALIDELFARCSYDQGNLLRMTAHRAKAANEFLRGRFSSARQNFEISVGLYDPKYQASVTYSIGLDALVAASGYNALVCWCLGDSEAAEENMDRALAHSARLDLAGSRAFATYHEALLRGVLMEQQDILVKNGRLLQKVGLEHHYNMWLACGRLLEAMGICCQKPSEHSIKLVDKRLEEFRDMGVVYLPTYETFIARRWLDLGKAREGLAHIKNARMLMEQFGEVWNEPEVGRVEAQLRLFEGCEPEVAEAILRQAVGVAKRQQSRSFGNRIESDHRALQEKIVSTRNDLFA